MLHSWAGHPICHPSQIIAAWCSLLFSEPIMSPKILFINMCEIPHCYFGPFTNYIDNHHKIVSSTMKSSRNKKKNMWKYLHINIYIWKYDCILCLIPRNGKHKIDGSVKGDPSICLVCLWQPFRPRLDKRESTYLLQVWVGDVDRCCLGNNSI